MPKQARKAPKDRSMEPPYKRKRVDATIPNATATAAAAQNNEEIDAAQSLISSSENRSNIDKLDQPPLGTPVKVKLKRHICRNKPKFGIQCVTVSCPKCDFKFSPSAIEKKKNLSSGIHTYNYNWWYAMFHVHWISKCCSSTWNLLMDPPKCKEYKIMGWITLHFRPAPKEATDHADSVWRHASYPCKNKAWIWY